MFHLRVVTTAYIADPEADLANIALSDSLVAHSGHRPYVQRRSVRKEPANVGVVDLEKKCQYRSHLFEFRSRKDLT